MRMLFTGLWMVTLLASLAHAEPRWCSIQPDSAYKIVYPAIARAAQVSGIVIARITYVPTGEVVKVEPVVGPAMLKDRVATEVQEWKIHTDAIGSEPCMSLAIFDFGFDHATPFLGPPPDGVLRMSIVSTAMPFEAYQAHIGKKHWWSRK